jgi:hypothetical protein
MTRAEALARLRAMTAADSAPTLTGEEIETLLAMNALADSSGVAPGGTDYVETWDLNRAAAEGWRWKAAKVAGEFDFQADGAQYNRSQKLDMCNKMVAQYQRRIISYAVVASPVAASSASYVEDDD